MANQDARIDEAPKWPMSAYMASPPVTARKAAPSMAKEMPGPTWIMKPSAAQGFAAARIAGALAMP